MNQTAAPPSADPSAAKLRSVHTTSFPGLLEQLGASLLVSTYQAGKLVLVRAHNGRLNTHFRTFRSPMGLAGDATRFTVGTQCEVLEFRNQPEVAHKLPPAGTHDGCFLPRAAHVTGDIRIHEIAWADGPAGVEKELWIVNTRFSCLCTLDADYSFVPRWRPPFVTALAPEDRCHLNGLGLRGNRPRYVTCLGRTDTPGGWRPGKARGGCLLEVPSGAVLAEGLSMPHSPRWYGNELWLLESGTGGFGRIDLAGGRLETIAELPGFTRGLDFHGPFAFIGLSQVRETATFSGLPITERAQERTCGVWVVDVRSGRTVAFLRFEAAVQEIFAVLVLPGLRFPEVLTEDQERIASSFILPAEALADVPG
jgi:uncharacterized protein (TIGR03032 family)